MRDPKTLERDNQALAAGINAMDHYENIPQVISIVFAFDGLSVKSAAEHIQMPGVDLVCRLNGYTIAKPKLGYSRGGASKELWGEGEDALGALFFLVEQAQENYLQAMRFVRPQWRRYFHAPAVLKETTR